VIDDRTEMVSVELRQLRYFVAVAEERHFGHAADRLRIAQPGLSQQIKVLERGVGAELFVRDRRGVRLTPAGAALLDHARIILELADRAVESTRLVATGKRGTIKVGTRAAGIPSLGRLLLSTFQESVPDVELQIFPGLTPQGVEGVTKRALDVSIVVAPFDGPEDLRYLPLDVCEILVAIPEGHRLAEFKRIPRAELLEEPFLDWPRSANPQLVDHLHGLLFGRKSPQASLEIADVAESSRLQLVAEGRGLAVTLFPTPADLAINGVVFRRIEPPTPTVEYGMVWLEPEISPFLPVFLDLARGISTRSERDREAEKRDQ
jgi:DNA-binding transcriptional LysR family regulator